MGSLVVIIGCLILLAGKWSATLLIEKVSLVATFLGLTWLLLGTRYLKILWLPISYLLFMFPLFEKSLGTLSIYFQLLTAWIALAFLKLTGMPVVLSDTYIELPHITLEIGRACSGISQIFALVALAVFVAYVTEGTRRRGVFLALSAFAIGVVLNGFRVALIAFWTGIRGEGFEHGPFDIFYVSFVFIGGVSILLLLSAMKGKVRGIRVVRTQVVNHNASQPRVEDSARHCKAVAAALLLLSLTGGSLYMYTRPCISEKTT